MGLLEIASGNSLWRGYDYYKDSKVKTWQKSDDGHYIGVVEGSEGNLYQVTIDLKHPKKSQCDCPHAEGSRRVCKHKVALYFSAFPEEADRLIKEAEEWEAEEEKRWHEECADVRKYVNSLSKKELQEELYNRIIEEKERRNWYY